jgi:3-mercaptopyruvate sulfurtransferase SseA
MTTEQEWVDRTKRFMKAELKRRDVTYEELARRLSEAGIEETKASVASKISRGGFTAAFFLASMKAVGCPAVRVEDV